MYPAASTIDLAQYDFSAKENESKWRGLFISGLKKVSQHVGYSMKAKEDALDYLERLILQLLGLICTRPSPHTVQEIQDRVQKMFPPPIDKWAIDEATSAIKQTKKKSDTVFPQAKIHSLLQKEVLQHKIEHNVTVYISAVLEYIAADIIHLVGNYVKHSRNGEFTTQDIKAAMCCDKVLCDLFKLGDNIGSVSLVEEPITRNSLSYNEVVQDLLQSERQYLRDLQMLIKVFRDQLADQLEKKTQSLELVFLSVSDIAELTMTLISTVEDTLEMTEPNQVPAIGICLLELAENWEFEVYDKYAEAYADCKDKLMELLSRPDVELTLSTAGHGFVEAVKFYFPKLLLEPFHHCPQYFEYIKVLYRLSPSETDKTDLLQADSVLTSLKAALESLNIPKKTTGDLCSRMSGKGNKQIAQQKLMEIKGQIEGFNDSLGQSYFNEFFCEGELQKIGPGKKPSERHAYLFDGYMFLCKPNFRRTSVVTGGPQHEYRLKESFCLTKVEVRDREDIKIYNEESRHLFEISPRDQSPIVLSARSSEEKSSWMSVLVMLTTKSMLDRILDRILSDDVKKHPLKLPPEESYRFAVPDSDENIVFDKDTGSHSVIVGATLLKLVERLTHHQYSDPNFNNTFLTTYRTFCSTHEFLDLLIERFNIPDPQLPEEEIESIHAREMLKRFRKEYARHVKLRVLNVIKQWVIHHFYDFERNPFLQTRLEEFLEEADDPKKKNFIFESVRRCLRKAVENSNADLDRSYSAVKSPPPIEYHIKCPISEWSILTIHPIEFARQLTLLEFDYYRVVKSSELVGSVWTKMNKDEYSPNLLRMIKHTTNVTRWFEKTIVDTDNLEERVAVVSRILEVMMVLQELNNFNGVIAVAGAMDSASVHRLEHTFQAVSPRLLKALEDARDLTKNHYKRYQERLRSINPPCVPFFGMYMTNILHTEEGNLDFLPNSNELINFAKRRMVAEITSEIRQFQYSHYVLSVECKLREFIESIQPFDSDLAVSKICDYTYARSMEIEPRKKPPTKSARKWPELNLKSPGIKPRHLPGRSHPGPLMPFSNSTLSLHSSTSRMTLDTDFDLTNESTCQTPKTLTPSSIPSATSPLGGIDNDDAVFVPVLIGGTVHHPTPPPLPPRKNRDDSTGDATSPSVCDAPEMPPPLPPRKVSPRTPNPPIPRRNSSAISVDSSSQPPSLSPKRNTPNQNGPPHILFTSSPNPSVSYDCGADRTAFEFHAQLSPIRVGPKPLPPLSAMSSPPKLPPKTTKVGNNTSHN